MRIEKFTNLYRDVTKEGTKIPQEKYCLTGQFPIVDQGQRVIAGWWNDDAGIFKNVPAIIFGDHTRAIKYMEQPFFIGADGVKILRPTNIKDNPKYLYYALQAAKIPNLGYSRHFKVVKELQICIYSRDEQNEIVRVLEKIDYLIEQRHAETTYLDQLVKSRFIELFGDPERNPKKWPVVSITEIIRGKVSNGFFAKRDAYRNDGNVQVLGVANIVNRMYSNIEGLPRTNATQAEKEKYRVRYGDMLFCRSSLVAEGIGKASIVPQDTPQNVIFECHVIRLPLDLQKCVPEFVQELSTTPYFRKQIIAQSKTATMTTIGQDGILKAAIILPPVERQQEFLRFVEQTDKSKLCGKMEVAA